MGYLFSAMQTKVVKGNMMKDIGPEDEIAANVKHMDAENSAMKGIAALQFSIVVTYITTFWFKTKQKYKRK